MKTKLLRRLRAEADVAICVIQIEAKFMGYGRNVWRINGYPITDAYAEDEAIKKVEINRRRYILRQVAKLKQKSNEEDNV